MKPRILNSHWIIHIFALAHALTVILLSLINIETAIPLTVLTIILVLLLTKGSNYPLDISAAIALLCSFAGFFLGTKGALVISLLIPDVANQYVEAITTCLVTEILGWLVYFIVHRLKKSE